MRCPRCGGRLTTETLGGRPHHGGPYRSIEQPLLPEEAIDEIWIERCADCKGLWFDEGEMVEAIQSMKLQTLPGPPRDFVQQRGTRIGRCPSCGSEMETVQSQAAPAVEFDRCTECRGIWLDAGEAEQFSDEHVGLLALMLHEFG